MTYSYIQVYQSVLGSNDSSHRNHVHICLMWSTAYLYTYMYVYHCNTTQTTNEWGGKASGGNSFRWAGEAVIAS
jgi:hypothetical protein